MYLSAVNMHWLLNGLNYPAPCCGHPFVILYVQRFFCMKYIIYRFLTALFFLLFINTATAQTNKHPHPKNIYVSPAGNDAGTGSIGKPFATIERALQELTQPHENQAVNVFLQGGTYYLSNILNITAMHSGTVAAPVTIQAFAGEQVVVSGGQRLRLKWTHYKSGIYVADVPAGLATGQLFVNGEQQWMARFPDHDSAAQFYFGTDAEAFGPKRVATWANPAGGFIHAMHKAMWGDYHYRITGKKDDSTLIYEGGWQNNRQMGMHKDRRFVENIFEELDAPHEWFLDTKNHKLYYYPPAGVNIQQAVVEADRLKHLIELNGSEASPVEHIAIKNIMFKHAARSFMENREPLLRSDWTTYRGGAIFLTGTKNCSIINCTLEQVGGNGIFINNFNREVQIKGCHIYKAGGNGIAFVGDPKSVRSPLFEYGQVQALDSIDRTPGPLTNNYPADCLVDDCLIHETGMIEKQTAGVQIDMSQRITVRHCSIYDLPRAGINIGSGCWGGHIIEYCDVFNTVKETGDHGSFNSWGRDRFWVKDVNEVNRRVAQVPSLPLLDAVETTIIRNSRWRCDHGWDIDLDDGSSNYEIYNNLCLNGGLKNREGYLRNVYNNMLVNNSYYLHVWFKNSSDIFTRNIVFAPYKPIRVDTPWGKIFDHNFLHVKGAVLQPAKLLQQLSARDAHSQAGDAAFINAAVGDYRLADSSPVLGLGFRPFAMDNFGVSDVKLKALAKTPLLVKTLDAAALQSRDTTVVFWHGITLRNIGDEGEMSVYGTPGVAGVLVLQLPAGYKGGLQLNDVILGADNKKLLAVKELPAENIRIDKLLILRRQRETEVAL